jgi:hypothetical protein
MADKVTPEGVIEYMNVANIVSWMPMPATGLKP